MPADLEAALDGLQAAESYAESIGESELAHLIAQDYQRLGAAAPEEDWDA